MFFRKKQVSDKQSEQRWFDLAERYLEQQEKMATQSYLLSVASELAQPLVSGKQPAEAVETFAVVHQLVQEWYRGAPIKAEILKVLDAFLPDAHIDNWDAPIGKQ